MHSCCSNKSTSVYNCGSSCTSISVYIAHRVPIKSNNTFEIDVYQAVQTIMTYNSSIKFPTRNYALATVTSVQSVVGIISNIVIIATMLLAGRRRRKTPSDIMVLNLSFADLLPCLTFLPWMTFQLIQGQHSEPTMYFFCALFELSLRCSQNAIFAVTLDRYIAICFPLRYKSIISPKRICLIVSSVWILGILFSLAFLLEQFYRKVDDHGIHIHIDFAYRILDCLQVILIFVMCAIIFNQARKQSLRQCQVSPEQQLHLGDGRFPSSKYSKNRRKVLVGLLKSAKRTYAVALLYCLTLLPVLIATIGKAFIEISEEWMTPLLCIAFFNSCINPFIYSFGSARFRLMFRN